MTPLGHVQFMESAEYGRVGTTHRYSLISQLVNDVVSNNKFCKIARRGKRSSSLS